MNQLKVFRNEILVEENEVLDEMFFITNGRVKVDFMYKNIQHKILYLRKREHFGEVCILLDEKSPVQLRVVSDYAELFLIKKIDMIKVNLDGNKKFKELFEVSYHNFSIIKYKIKFIKYK